MENSCILLKSALLLKNFRIFFPKFILEILIINKNKKYLFRISVITTIIIAGLPQGTKCHRDVGVVFNHMRLSVGVCNPLHHSPRRGVILSVEVT